MAAASPYPLHWPPGFPRSKYREAGSFKTTLSAAMKNVDGELQRFANDSNKRITGIVLSSNVTLGAHQPSDPGVAAWFTWDGMEVCIAVDRYTTVQANLQAIYHILAARRVELRHGTLALVRATLQGFLALPAPAGSRTCWEILELAPSASRLEIEAAYRAAASRYHPDRTGGDGAQMAEINRARDQALGAV